MSLRSPLQGLLKNDQKGPSPQGSNSRGLCNPFLRRFRGNHEELFLPKRRCAGASAFRSAVAMICISRFLLSCGLRLSFSIHTALRGFPLRSSPLPTHTHSLSLPGTPPPHISPGTSRAHPLQRGVDVDRGPRRKPLPAGTGHGRVREQANCGVWLTARCHEHRDAQPPTQRTRRGTTCPGAPQCALHMTN